MRRLAVILVLAGAGLVLHSNPAYAATVGINFNHVATGAELAHVHGAGARSVRMFVHADRLSAAAIAEYQRAVSTSAQLGMTPILAVVDSSLTAPAPAGFAARAGELARSLRGQAPTIAYEIWNEEDSPEWWKPAPDPAAYVALVNATSAAIRQNDPAAGVVLGPLTGNNYDFLERLYGAGLNSATFDAVSVHTDTDCLTAPPDSFYRDGGRIGRFTFLGYREVRATMLARGDDKPIWMTELGWSSTQGADMPLCDRGMWAGQKRSGVTEEQQADFLKQAYHCLALDPYVQQAVWFTYANDPAQRIDQLRHYGLLHSDGSAKPAWHAFRAVGAAPGGDLYPGTGCGDFDAPAITLVAPRPGHKFLGTLLVQARAADAGVGLGRITFRVDGNADEIINFTKDLANGKLASLDWQRAKRLGLGKHTITVEAVDKNGNRSSTSVEVEKVRRLAATLASRTRVFSLRCKRRRCVVRGKVSGPAGISIDGKVRVLWQHRTRGRYKTNHKASRNANKPFTFVQRLRKRGAWRVVVRYLGTAPLKPSSSAPRSFRVR